MTYPPTADGRIRVLAPSEDGKIIFVGGGFVVTIDGHARPFVAAVDVTTGAFDTDWGPSTGPNGALWELVVSGDRVYDGEQGAGDKIAAYEASTGSRIWDTPRRKAMFRP